MEGREKRPHRGPPLPRHPLRSLCAAEARERSHQMGSGQEGAAVETIASGCRRRGACGTGDRSGKGPAGSFSALHGEAPELRGLSPTVASPEKGPVGRAPPWQDPFRARNAAQLRTASCLRREVYYDGQGSAAQDIEVVLKAAPMPPRRS